MLKNITIVLLCFVACNCSNVERKNILKNKFIYGAWACEFDTNLFFYLEFTEDKYCTSFSTDKEQICFDFVIIDSNYIEYYVPQLNTYKLNENDPDSFIDTFTIKLLKTSNDTLELGYVEIQRKIKFYKIKSNGGLLNSIPD